MSIVKNGIFTIPLYHGKTSLFIDSINEFGLGGKSPLVELGVADIFSNLYDLGDKVLGQNEGWLKNREIVKPIAKQLYLGNNFSFRYGESYLAVWKDVAVSYATNSYHGSEQLQFMKGLLTYLQKKNVDGWQAIVPKQIIELIERRYDPILITLHNVLLEDVATETGEPKLEQIEKTDSDMKKGITPPLSFKLRQPYSKENFTVEFL